MLILLGWGWCWLIRDGGFRAEFLDCGGRDPTCGGDARGYDHCGCQA